MKPTLKLGQLRAMDNRLNAKIWAEREHICKECGFVLPDPVRKTYFAHILSKGAFPKFRHREDNIMLLCVKCHYRYDHGTRQRMNIWEFCNEKISQLKREYYEK